MPLSPRKSARLTRLTLRIDRLDAHLRVLHHTERRYPWIRAAVFVFGVAATAAAYLTGTGRWGTPVLALSLVVFIIVAFFHRRVTDAIARWEALRRLAIENDARARLDWDVIPPYAGFPPEKGHPFEMDLDLTGRRSLHRLLDTAASLGGSERLRSWLLAPLPDPAASARRRSAVRDLIALPGFRAHLALAGAQLEQRGKRAPGSRWDTTPLLAWTQRLPLAPLGTFVIVLSVLAILADGIFVYFILNRVPLWWWLAAVGLFWLVQSLRYRDTSALFDEAYALLRDLTAFRRVLEVLEGTRYPPGSELAAFAAPFWQPERCPSRSLRRLTGIVTAASFRSNAVTGLLLNTFLPWDAFFTAQFERFRADLREILPGWLDAWFDIEALCSLATFADLNPDTIFPEILPLEAPGPVFAAKAIGHPLLPDKIRVCNDFEVPSLGEVTVITGSNMSGKSTFLRTVGVNLVLAGAGGTVLARCLHTQPFRLYTCISVSDSLSDGISYFYAEVRRLKGLLDALRAPDPLPLFYLIDEIFRGTNNRERRQGSQAYVEALANGHGTGLVSTHDLELVRLADTIPQVRNFHFREEVSDGRMVFEYLIRPGSSPTTNALKIMEIEGLPVGENK